MCGHGVVNSAKQRKSENGKRFLKENKKTERKTIRILKLRDNK
jgi:hypothetical protein